MKIDIKPLSSNQAYQGRKVKTEKYRNYEKELMYLLPKDLNIPDGFLKIWLNFGFSDGHSDFDNPIKPFVDILQKKYFFNDNRIKKSILVVTKVKKGDEFIDFDIKGISADNEISIKSAWLLM